MKANEAPEKIYCGNNGHGNLSYSNKPFPNAVEYTRTDALDAFIEKAKKWFEQQPKTYDANGVRVYGDKDFDDFRKYMEGE